MISGCHGVVKAVGWKRTMGMGFVLRVMEMFCNKIVMTLYSTEFMTLYSAECTKNH